MTFREAFLQSASDHKGVSAYYLERVKQARDADPKKHRLLWKAMENIVVHRYERATGQKVTSFGDGAFLKWLVDNLPTILTLLMKILALFGV